MALFAALAGQPVFVHHLDDVHAALQAGVPAAQVYPQSVHASDAHPHEVRIAFDGDAVLFSDEAERIFQSEGLNAFSRTKRKKPANLCPPGRSSRCCRGATTATAGHRLHHAHPHRAGDGLAPRRTSAPSAR